MPWIKRIVLFVLMNALVVLTISFLLNLFKVQPFLEEYGLNIPALALFCLIWGMGGAFISLALSKTMAKLLMGVQLINPSTKDPLHQELLQTVYQLAKMAGLPTLPEVGIYRSLELNAFATGPSRRRALVAVSTGLVERMNKQEISAVLGHEVAHIANGDMVTMTLLQGIINAFVMFLARILAFILSKSSGKERNSGNNGFFYLFVFVFEMIFMTLGALVIARFSRFREFRADAGGARLAGKENMIAALQTLKSTSAIQDPRKKQPAFQALKISSQGNFMRLFSSHPPLEERIATLKKLSLRNISA